MVPNVFIDNQPDNAVWYYHHPHYRYNCAQAMVKHFGGSEADVSQMKTMGSGRAPKGYCGALYGALFMSDYNQKSHEKIIEKFTQKTGSPFCRKIRKAGNTSCQQCIEIADSILKEVQKPSDAQKLCP